MPKLPNLLSAAPGECWPGETCDARYAAGARAGSGADWPASAPVATGARLSNVRFLAIPRGAGSRSCAALMSDTSNVAVRACWPALAGTGRARRASMERSTSRARASASTAFAACGLGVSSARQVE